MKEAIHMLAEKGECFDFLEKDFYGKPLNTLSNFCFILEKDKALKNICFNELSGGIDTSGELPWRKETRKWSNSDFSNLLLYLERMYGLYAPNKCKDAIEAVLHTKRRWNPIKDYLLSLSWDGVSRLDTLLIDFLGATDSKYVRAVTRKTFTAAVARVFEPGIKFDYVLVLCGTQGIGKSTFFSKLGKEWYSDSMTIADMRDKTACEKLRGIWIMELGELAGLRKVDVETVKAFISRPSDTYRPAYGVYAESYPRTGIIVGTTNAKDGFLRDITGNRRFWPVTVNRTSSDEWKLDDLNVDQIWAEAAERYKAKENIYLDYTEEDIAKTHQRKALESDPRSGIIGEYLSQSENEMICLMDIWCKCLGKNRQDMKKKDAYELSGIIEKIGGWEPYSGNCSGKVRTKEYGVQRVYVYTGSN